jgi:hypothetical protein
MSTPNCTDATSVQESAPKQATSAAASEVHDEFKEGSLTSQLFPRGGIDYIQGPQAVDFAHQCPVPQNNLSEILGQQVGGNAEPPIGSELSDLLRLVQDMQNNNLTGVLQDISQLWNDMDGGDSPQPPYSPPSSPIAPPGGDPITPPGGDPITPPGVPTTPPGGDPTLPPGGGPNTPPTGTDLSSIFTQGDSGVTSPQMQHAIDIANSLPEDMKQALLANGVTMELDSGFNGGPEGQNDGTYGQFYVDSGMADQAEVHELYEMYGQVTANGAGSWSDSQAVGIADNTMSRTDCSGEADLNDTVGNIQGDGDHMSNAFTADFFATHPGLDQDVYGQSVLSQTEQDDPTLEAYIANAQGLADA